MGDGIIDCLERARAQIESKFTEAGTVLENTLTVLGRQLQALDQLNGVLDVAAVEAATQDLISTSEHLNALPAILGGRMERLGTLQASGDEVRQNIEKLRDLFGYLQTFALNLKVAGASTGTDAAQFADFSQEMRVRIVHGQEQLGDFDARLTQLGERTLTALRLERDLAERTRTMLPAVPDRLSRDAAAIGTFHKRIAETTSAVSVLAQRIQRQLESALSALQVGDITRQRVEHVQSALAMLDEADARMAEQGGSDAGRAQLKRLVHRLQAEQLADTGRDFTQETARMFQGMSDMAADTRELCSLQRLAGTPDTAGTGLRSLENSVAEALELISGMDQLADGANKIQESTRSAVEELVTRVSSIKAAKEDVQYMALNTTLRCSRMGEAGKPLQVIAVELGLYAKTLNATADETVMLLQALSAAAADLNSGGYVDAARAKLEASIARLRAAADVAEKDMASITAQNRDLVTALSGATERLNFKAELADVIAEAAEALFASAGDGPLETGATGGPLEELLERIANTYTMHQERDVHAAFAALIGGIEGEDGAGQPLLASA